jgi:hypothetical protein
MDIYTYISTSNPYQAKAILHKYGYSTQGVKDAEDLGACLKQLVAYEGESAFSDILGSHPDIGVIIEKYNSEKKENFMNYNGNNANGCGCGCSANRQNDRNYNNFSGDVANVASRSSREVSAFILAAALMLAAAIIVKK